MWVDSQVAISDMASPSCSQSIAESLIAQNQVAHSDTKDTHIREHMEGNTSSKDVQELIDLFKPVNPTAYQLFSNKTERAALQRMLKQFGWPHLEERIRLLPQTNAERYAPTMTTPYQLERDMGRLEAFLKRQGPSSKLTQDKYATL
jgi:hypothetical protein